MYLSGKVLFVLMYCVSTIVTKPTDYCEWGYCAPSEYCCGDNECCKDEKTTWILMIGLLIALIVASVCCACFYRRIDYYLIRSQWRFFSARESLVPDDKA